MFLVQKEFDVDDVKKVCATMNSPQKVLEPTSRPVISCIIKEAEKFPQTHRNRARKRKLSGVCV